MHSYKNEVPMIGQVEVFCFSSEKSPVRVQLIDNEPWFVAIDVCQVLGISNNRDAVSRLDDDEKTTSVLPTQFGDKGMWLVSESGLYALIFQSRKTEAKKFRKWVTGEVLPAIRRKGYYVLRKQEGDYMDARDIPYTRKIYNGGEVRVVEIAGEKWYSLNDVHSCVGSRTSSNQSVRRLNARRPLARKIWLYGATQPSWFTTLLGVRLIVGGSVKAKNEGMLVLDFNGMED